MPGQDIQHEKDLERIRNFRLMDDDFFTKCFENNVEGTNLLLDLILPIKLVVHRVTTQATIKNLQGRSLRLDVLAENKETQDKVNVEIQRESRGAGAKRARYHGSILDANSIIAGENFDDLPENFVVFITEKDVFHNGLPVYMIDRYFFTPDGAVPFDDKLHIIYVNGSHQDDTPLGLLMKDFHCTNPDDMHYKVLADRVRYFKKNEEGVAAMCEAMEEMRNEAKEEERLTSIQKLMKNMQLTAKQAMDALEIPESEQGKYVAQL